MALYDPPWKLTPYFTDRQTSVITGANAGQLVAADTSRILIVLSGSAGPINIGRQQVNPALDGIVIPVASLPFVMDFGTWGGVVCSQWFVTPGANLKVYEVFYRPPTYKRNK